MEFTPNEHLEDSEDGVAHARCSEDLVNDITPEVYEEYLKVFFNHCKSLVEDHGTNSTLMIKNGKKYLKFCVARLDDPGNGFSAWAFVDKKAGDVFKAASWSSPAKHARGNIFKTDVKDCVTWAGPNYLR